MFGWFGKRKKRPQPEELWIVSVGPHQIDVTDDVGRVASLAKSDLAGVAIETNDTGPWGADVWWLLFRSDEQLACAFPQGAIGERNAMDYLTALPGFDYKQMTNAMCSTANAVFLVWTKVR